MSFKLMFLTLISVNDKTCEAVIANEKKSYQEL